MKRVTVFLAPLMLILLNGCAAPIVGSLTLSHLSSIASAFSMTVKGKGAGEVALDLATGKDCRLVEGMIRDSRAICEQPGSVATAGDFKGVIALLKDEPPSVGGKDTPAAEVKVAASPSQPPAPLPPAPLRVSEPDAVAEAAPAQFIFTADASIAALALLEISPRGKPEIIPRRKPEILAHKPASRLASLAVPRHRPTARFARIASAAP